MIKSYNVKYKGEYNLTNNFKVKEFACKDDFPIVLIDIYLVNILQELRDYLGKPITIISGYRTDSYNKKIGGSNYSYHIVGQAIDFTCDYDMNKIAIWLENYGIKGIGLYIDKNSYDYIHIDSRSNKYYWKQIKTNETKEQFEVTTFK